MEDEDKMSERCDAEKDDERPVVAFSYTVDDKEAVVIKVPDASMAQPTVLRTSRPNDLKQMEGKRYLVSMSFEMMGGGGGE